MPQSPLEKEEELAPRTEADPHGGGNSGGSQSSHRVMVCDHAKEEFLENQVLKAVEEEKVRMARELHDGLGSLLTATQVQAHVLGVRLGHLELSKEAAEARAISGQLVEALRQLRILVRGLHPLDGSLDSLLHGLRGLVQRIRATRNMNCRLLLPKAPLELANAHVANQLYRIAEEAIHNAQRHSKAKHLTVSLKDQGSQLLLQVNDNGTGFDPAAQSGGHGLLIMCYRACSMGGSLTIKARPGAGTKVICAVPGASTAAAAIDDEQSLPPQ
jgi:signal transduction histidine kinase